MEDIKKTMKRNEDLGTSEVNMKELSNGIAPSKEERYNGENPREYLDCISSILLVYARHLKEKGELK